MSLVFLRSCTLPPPASLCCTHRIHVGPRGESWYGRRDSSLLPGPVTSEALHQGLQWIPETSALFQMTRRREVLSQCHARTCLPVVVTEELRLPARAGASPLYFNQGHGCFAQVWCLIRAIFFLRVCCQFHEYLLGISLAFFWQNMVLTHFWNICSRLQGVSQFLQKFCFLLTGRQKV